MLLDGKSLKCGHTNIFIPDGPSEIRDVLTEYINGKPFDLFINHTEACFEKEER